MGDEPCETARLIENVPVPIGSAYRAACRSATVTTVRRMLGMVAPRPRTRASRRVVCMAAGRI